MADARSENDSISMRVTLFGIRKAFPAVKQLDTEELEKLIHTNEYKNLILLDVREKNEFEVSHLPNAILIKPDEPVEQVMKKIKQSLENAPNNHVKIVCYCAIGYRSSRMAQKLYPEFKLMKENEVIDMASELWNLEGSLIKWANERKELVDCSNKQTQYCHPYNSMWAKLLDATLRKYEPDEAASTSSKY